MRDPFVLDVGNVLGVAGVRHGYTLDGQLPGIGLPPAKVPDDSEVAVEVVLEAQGAAVIAEGTISADWVGECRRCLELTSGRVEVGFREIYSEDPVEGETFPLEDERVDLRPMVREALTLALPLVPLCSEGCVGPDPEAHPVRHGDALGQGGEDEASAEDEEEAGKDVWAALDQLRLDG